MCPVNCIHPTPENAVSAPRIFCTSIRRRIDWCVRRCLFGERHLPGRQTRHQGQGYSSTHADYYKSHPDIQSGYRTHRRRTARHGAAFPRWWPPPTTTGLASPTRTSRKLPADLRIALVGTGLSAVMPLRTLIDRTEAQVTVIDRLPTPGGRACAGCGPDHPGHEGCPAQR